MAISAPVLATNTLAVPNRYKQYSGYRGGTTGKAAQDLGRDFIGIEKDAGYFAQATRRIESVQPALMEAAD